MKVFLSVAVLAMVLGYSGTAPAASDMYLKLDGIKGETSDKKKAKSKADQKSSGKNVKGQKGDQKKKSGEAARKKGNVDKNPKVEEGRK